MNTATTDDFFRSRLDQMIELRHPLAVLASRMPWQEIEASVAQCLARNAGHKHRWPCDPSLLVRFRRSLGKEGVEQLLKKATDAG